MLKYRVIPIVLIDGYSVVKTIRFNIRRNLGNPIAIARIYNTRNVDELVLLDIDASKYGEKIDEFTISEIASECFMPLAVGGGLRNCEDISKVLSKGADKVVLNSITLENENIIQDASLTFGAQCIVVSIDVKKHKSGDYHIYSHANKSCKYDLLEWVKQVEILGAGEIILNSVDNDGVMEGCDLDLIRLVSSAVEVPVISVGGIGKPSDAVKAVNSGAAAVAAASIFHFTKATPDNVRKEMEKSGLPVRD
uniref:imidazole glycerol-phosphate synthase n=1 Tax=Candidatus Kentrum sp. MB TaxID=2138164 RepID=A0A450XEV9_9GAMM|nr:MAG: cyclase [Candidatus Kentron sp. MB]VFK30241.1 MAG: cyclase [Candidatus Kentron sp. MB]VFK75147.1 MAG: cyclase [Candidatus Kentron sp. MB]